MRHCDIAATESDQAKVMVGIQEMLVLEDGLIVALKAGAYDQENASTLFDALGHVWSGLYAGHRLGRRYRNQEREEVPVCPLRVNRCLFT